MKIMNFTRLDKEIEEMKSATDEGARLSYAVEIMNKLLEVNEEIDTRLIETRIAAGICERHTTDMGIR